MEWLLPAGQLTLRRKGTISNKRVKSQRMRVFISWSGQRSKRVALAMREWLPSVLQAVEPFMSAEDIPKGAQWTARLVSELKESSYAIICVTGDNQDKPWLNFEAGALSQALTDSRVSPYLVGIRNTDVTGPLSIYQMAEANEADTLRLLRSVNDQLPLPLTDEKLSKTFNRWWPDLLSQLTAIGDVGTSPKPDSHRSVEEIVREVLEVVRTQARSLSMLATNTSRRSYNVGVGGFRIGQFVKHAKWGEGVVIDASGSDANPLLTVMFRSSVGQKMLNAKADALEKIARPVNTGAIYGAADALRVYRHAYYDEPSDEEHGGDDADEEDDDDDGEDE